MRTKENSTKLTAPPTSEAFAQELAKDPAWHFVQHQPQYDHVICTLVSDKSHWVWTPSRGFQQVQP